MLVKLVLSSLWTIVAAMSTGRHYTPKLQSISATDIDIANRFLQLNIDGFGSFKLRLTSLRAPDPALGLAHDTLIAAGEGSTGTWARLIVSPSTNKVLGAFETPDGNVWHLNGTRAWQEDRASQRILLARSDDAPSQSSFPYDPRSTLSQLVGDTSGCPSDSQTALVGIAADQQFVAKFTNSEDARLHILDVINKASQVWEDAFNISLQVNRIVLGNGSQSWDIACSRETSGLEDRLTQLQKWRSGISDGGLATWTLFTACPQGDTIGLSWEGMVCRSFGLSVIYHTILDYRVYAHEMGHSFGAMHDCDNVTCPSQNVPCCPFSQTECDARGNYIMNPASAENQVAFSKCSQGNVCSGIKGRKVDISCLVPSSGSEVSAKWRNTQCGDLLGVESARACSDSGCKLACFNPQNNSCVDVPSNFSDGTQCWLDNASGMWGQCITGRCLEVTTSTPGNADGNNTPTSPSPHPSLPGGDWWKWVVGIVAGAILVLSVIMALLSLWWRRRQSSIPPISSPRVITRYKGSQFEDGPPSIYQHKYQQRPLPHPFPPPAAAP